MRANTLICLITGGRRKPSIWRGLLAGIAGGVAGSVAISQFHALAGRWVKNSQPQQQGEDSTVKAASAVSETILDRPLEPNEKKPASQAVHYAFGTGVGAAYGALAEWKPAVARAAGAPFGAAVWVGAHEVTVPALGWSQPPIKEPLPMHTLELASHVVYGVTVESVRRLVRRLL